MLLVAMGFGVSCANDGIDDGGKTAVDSIAALDYQVAAMKQSVKDIQALEGDFSEAVDAIGRQISFIESGASQVEGSLATLSLQKDLAAIFGTDDVDLETINAGISAWMGSDFKELYPLAVAQAKINAVASSVEKQKVYAEALSSDVESGIKKDENPSELAGLVSSVEENGSKVEDLSADLSVVLSEVETAYQQAITKSSYDSEALKQVNKAAAAQTKAVDDSYAGLVARVAACEALIVQISERLGALEDEIEDLKELLGLIQSVTYVSEYAENNAVAYYNLDMGKFTVDNVATRTPTSQVNLDFLVRPASAAPALANMELWNKGVNVFGYYAQAITKSPTMFNMTVEDVSVSYTYGIVSVKVRNNFDQAFYYKKTGAKIALSVATGKTDLTSQFIEVVPKDASKTVYVESLTLLSDYVEIDDGQSKQLKLTVAPTNATDRSIVWTTSNPDVLQVSGDGVITAKSVGNAVITATSKSTDEWGNKLSVSCNVKVNSNVKIVGPGSVEPGGTIQLKVESQDYIDPQYIKWYSSNTAKAVVQDGIVTGVADTYDQSSKSYGAVEIKCRIYESIEIVHTIRVVKTQPQVIKIAGLADNQNNVTIKVGDTYSLAASFVPETLNDFSTFKIKYQSEAAAVAKVDYDSGLVTGLAGGGATILVRALASSTYDYYYPSRSELQRRVYFTVNPYWVTSVTLPETMTMTPGSTATLTPVFASDVAGVQPTYKTLTWTSSDNSIVSIDAKTGAMAAIKEGTVAITATTADSQAVPSGSAPKTATCMVTVKAPVAAIHIGDYFYSDGTWSTDKKSGKTVVGIVFAQANAAASDPILLRDYPTCSNGLVVALAEYTEQDFGSVSYSNGHSYYNGLGYDANSVVATDKINGYGNTLAHRDLHASKSDYCKFFNASTGVVATHTAKVPAPSKASAWYIPSYKEMQMLVENQSVVNAALTAAGGTPIADAYASDQSWDSNRATDWYWSSTIYGKGPSSGTYEHFKYPFDISKNGWTSNQQSSAKCRVRVVLAF